MAYGAFKGQKDKKTYNPHLLGPDGEDLSCAVEELVGSHLELVLGAGHQVNLDEKNDNLHQSLLHHHRLHIRCHHHSRLRQVHSSQCEGLGP